ncbi:ADP-heptose--LPS heptosyltransferase 2 [Phycisphaerales bacterium]|nr:ADP-heptose--LPS heptosyltransferase 2 [Phycisphaerales bacterium]
MHWHRLAMYLRSLRDRQYDLVIDAQGLARSAFMARATGAPHRVGHADAREFAALAYTQRVPADIEQHTVDRMLSLAAAVGAPAVADTRAMRLYTPPSAAGFTAKHPLIGGARYVVLSPTSRWPAKQWPDQRFATLASALARDGLTVVLVGSASERSQVPGCLALAEANPCVVDLLGRTSVGQLMDVLEHSALVVANDSAALHIAVGFNRPLIALYGPTRVHRVGPYRRAGDVIQHATARDRLDHKSSAARALMERISAAEVVAAARLRLG